MRVSPSSMPNSSYSASIMRSTQSTRSSPPSRHSCRCDLSERAAARPCGNIPFFRSRALAKATFVAPIPREVKAPSRGASGIGARGTHTFRRRRQARGAQEFRCSCRPVWPVDRPCARPKAPRGIVLDMDSSVSPTHGEQEMSVWNGHYACPVPAACRVGMRHRLSRRDNTFANQEKSQDSGTSARIA